MASPVGMRVPFSVHQEAIWMKPERRGVSKIVRPMVPMYIAMFLALLVVTYVPEFSEFLPRFFGLID